jgi:hypothetical protein
VGVHAVSRLASAQEIENIGRAGQVVFGVERVTGVFVDKLTVQNEVTQVTIDPITGQPVTSTTVREETASSTTIGLFGLNSEGPLGAFTPTSLASMPRLALDVLPVRGFSLGGSFAFLTRSGDVEGTTSVPSDVTHGTLVFYPRVGYAVAFNETVGFWPRAGIAYERDWVTLKVPDPSGGTVEATVSMSFTNVVVEGVFFVSPMEHFAIVGGPYGEIAVAGSLDSDTNDPTSTDQSEDAKMTSFGLWVGVVGYY